MVSTQPRATCASSTSRASATPRLRPGVTAPRNVSSPQGIPYRRSVGLVRAATGGRSGAAAGTLRSYSGQLGHTSIVLTADTYTSVLLELHFKAAEATARLVLQAAARNPGQRYRSTIDPPKSAAPDQPMRPEPFRPNRSRKVKRGKRGRAAMTHTRTHRERVVSRTGVVDHASITRGSPDGHRFRWIDKRRSGCFTVDPRRTRRLPVCVARGSTRSAARVLLLRLLPHRTR